MIFDSSWFGDPWSLGLTTWLAVGRQQNVYSTWAVSSTYLLKRLKTSIFFHKSKSLLTDGAQHKIPKSWGSKGHQTKVAKPVLKNWEYWRPRNLTGKIGSAVFPRIYRKLLLLQALGDTEFICLWFDIFDVFLMFAVRVCCMLFLYCREATWVDSNEAVVDRESGRHCKKTCQENVSYCF